MKKYFWVLLSVLTLCLGLTACGTDPDKDGGNTPAGSVNASEELQTQLNAISDEVIDADLTCTITLGNWPADTAPESEVALFEGYKATMAKQYPNVTLIPDYYS